MNEMIYDLATLVAAFVLAVVALVLLAYTDIPTEIGTTALGIAGGAFGIRSGRAMVSGR